MTPPRKVTIYVFCNSCEPEWHSIQALCECGRFVAGHVCSAHGYVRHDMGVTSTWQHEYYRAHLDEHHGEGAVWNLYWVDGSPRDSAEVMAAYAKHVALGDAEKNARVVT